MPSPAAILSLQGDLKISFDCDTEAVELAATNQVPNAMMEIYAASKKLAPSELDIPEKSDKANKPQPSEEVQVKEIDLGTGDLQIIWKVSNNKAEYEALLHGLRLAASLGIKRLLVYGDSAVVINQVNKSWDHNKENMDAYCLEVRMLENKFYGLEFHHIVRDNNVAADVLSKLGSIRAQVPAGVFVHELHTPSVPEPAPTTTDPVPLPAGKEDMMIDVDLATTLHRLHPRAEGSHRQEFRRATHPPGQVLHPSRGQSLQARHHFRSTREVRPMRRRQRHLGGDP
jgi:ribonuclease HI